MRVSGYLTVSLWSIFEAEGKRERGVLLKKLRSKGVPPQAVTFLSKKKEEGADSTGAGGIPSPSSGLHNNPPFLL